MAEEESPPGGWRGRTWRAIRPSAWLWGPVVVGLIIRCQGILYQVAGGDEIHTIRSALSMPLWKILITYRPSDNCIPLTAFSRLIMDAGFELTEMHLRFPMLMAGILILVMFPWWLAVRVGKPPAVALAWLLALSPLLVHYSRMIRSYTPIVLLGGAAIIAFDHWRRTGSRASAAGYVAAGAATVFFHLGAAPFVLSPFLFYAGGKLLGRPAGLPKWSSAILLGTSIVAAFGLFLVPAQASLRALIELKNEPLAVTRKTFFDVAELFSGTGIPLMTLLFWLAALRGLVVLVRRHPIFASYGAVLAVGQLIGLLILSPKAMAQPPIFARYLLVSLPIVLTWVAVGLAHPWDGLASRARPLQPAVAIAVVVALFFAGPLDERVGRLDPFVVQPASMLFYHRRQPNQQLKEPPPEIYSQLTEDGPLLEYPWHTTWRYSRMLVLYQKVHGREVLVAPAERLLWDERLNFHNMVTPRLKQILASRAAYFVVHLNPAAEERLQDRGRRGPAAHRDWMIQQGQLTKFGRQVLGRVNVFQQEWGPPDHESDSIRVWNLERLRRERTR